MKEYNDKMPSKYIMYLDANNLYGWAMSQYLPIGGFRWLTNKEINNTNLVEYKEDSKKRLILEVDLEYPTKLHDLRNDYPLAPEKVGVTKHMLSDYEMRKGFFAYICEAFVYRMRKSSSQEGFRNF